MAPQVYFATLPPKITLVMDDDYLLVNQAWYDSVDDETVRAHLTALGGRNPAIPIRGWVRAGHRPTARDVDALLVAWQGLLDDAARTRRGVDPPA